MVNQRGGLVIFVTLTIGVLLTIMPIPEWARPYRPSWYILVLIYWVMALPQRVGVGHAWLLGIAMDVVTGTLLGQHSIGLSIVAFVVHQIHLRLRLFPLWQQSLMILPLLLLERGIGFWGMGVTHQPLPYLDYWLAPFVAILFWPWLYILLRDVRRRFVS
jgi:rod shape-determining protein MreD